MSERGAKGWLAARRVGGEGQEEGTASSSSALGGTLTSSTLLDETLRGQVGPCGVCGPRLLNSEGLSARAVTAGSLRAPFDGAVARTLGSCDAPAFRLDIIDSSTTSGAIFGKQRSVHRSRSS